MPIKLPDHRAWPGALPALAHPPGLHRRALLAALPSALVMLGPATPALAADAALAPPDAEVRRTRAQLDALDQLLSQAWLAQNTAQSLAWTLQRLVDQWQDAQTARHGRGSGSGSSAALPAMLAALRSQTLPGLADQQARWQATVRQVDGSAEAHLAAVQAVLTAPRARRAAAMARLDTAAATRQVAETAERTAWRALGEVMQQGSASLDALDPRWRMLGEALAGTADGLRRAAPDWAALHDQWLALRAAAQAADLADAPLPALPQPVAPWASPAAWTPPDPPDGQPLRAWDNSLQSADQAQRARWLQADALAAAQQALADATCRRPAADARAACDAWQADAAALQSGLAAQQTALRQAWGEQARAAAAQQDQLAGAQAQLQAMLDWQDSLAPAATTAGGSALQALQSAIATSQATVARLSLARRQAEDAWIAAWRRQYGSNPPRPAAAAPAPAMAPPPPMGPTASMRPMLSRHALQRLRKRNHEEPGFAAYTYVLVGAGVKPGMSGVFNRLQRLLAAVQYLPTAAELSAAERASANTFVVPVPADSDEGGPLVVDLTLAQSLLTHLPQALRLADATRRQLYLENGPFLITLPGRMADARADWPLLFADLSRTPEAVVTDVVRRYMADLIGSFNPASTDWKPPAGMQVAITLVRLVKGSGDVAQAVFGGLGR